MAVNSQGRVSIPSRDRMSRGAHLAKRSLPEGQWLMVRSLAVVICDQLSRGLHERIGESYGGKPASTQKRNADQVLVVRWIQCRG